MSITINGTTGIAGVDGSASTPSVQGADANTGMFFPAADTVAVTTGGSERMRIDSSGNVGIGTSSPAGKLDLVTGVYRAYFDDYGGASARLNGVLANNSAYGPFSINGSVVAIQTGATERMRIDSSGNLLFNSGYGSVATAYGCRAWVIFAGASGTVSGSGNVTSVSRSAVGTYTINFTSAMPNANYCITGVSSGSTSGSTSISGAGASGDFSRSTGSVTVYSVDASGNANVDAVTVCVAIFR
jgi:hypothetical protein